MPSHLKFEIFKDKQGKHRWRLMSHMGKAMAQSSIGYSRKAVCMKAITSIQKNVHLADVV